MVRESPDRAVESPARRVNLTELAALAGMTEDAIRYRIAHGFLTAPVAGTFDRATALAEIRAKPKQKSGRRSGATIAQGEGRQAEIRYRLARAEKEEALVERLRGQSMPMIQAIRTEEAFIRELRAALDEVPAAECDALAEAMAQDCTAATAKRELERIVRQHEERMSRRAFQMAEEQSA